MYKIIGADQKEYGPVTTEQLRQWISEGRVNAATKVQAVGLDGWKNASEFPEFAPLLTVVAPPFALSPGPVTMPPPPSVKTNPLAVWAMVTGIIALVPCCWPVGILPIILGSVALSQIKRNPPQNGTGFAIVGIVLGAIWLLLFGVTAITLYSSPQVLDAIKSSLNQ